MPKPAGLAGYIHVALLREVGIAGRLLQSKQPRDAVTHELRKALKRARAYLRLLREFIDQHDYRATNTALRDVGGEFRGRRDAEALLSTLQAISKRDPRGRPASRRLQRTLQGAIARQAVPAADAAGNAQRLADLVLQVATWEMPQGGRRAIRHALLHTFERARKAYRHAKDSGRAADWHECRKQTKYWRQQLYLLGAALPARLRSLAEDSDELADQLGEERDLLLLRTEAAKQQPLGRHDGRNDSTHDSQSALLAYIDQRRRKLRRHIDPRAKSIYRHKPTPISLR
ncbi:MAG TPA: CHAD domain-containing protein [Steroidobacteraceae bacterium]|nr:CHAD domain-containing protein [Steroidobacteraceae bacterium]